MRSVFFIFLSCFLSAKSVACLNLYTVNNEGQSIEYEGLPVFYRSFDTKYSQAFIDLVGWPQKEITDYKILSDVGFHLTHLKRFDEALGIFRWLYTKHPNEYKIISNLGTLYELTGQLDSAYFYIQNAVNINPNSHWGSEWVHLSILEAKIQMAKNPYWIYKNKVLNLNSKGKLELYNNRNLSIMETIYHISYQLEERIPFTPSHDLILANVLNELGEMLETHLSVTDAYVAYKMASHYDRYDVLNTQKKLAQNLLSIKKLRKQGKLEFDSGVFEEHFPAEEAYEVMNMKYLSDMLDQKGKKALSEAQAARKYHIDKFEHEKRSFFVRFFTILFGVIMFGVYLWSRR